ncbi:hypothetical protein ACWEN6_14050 [Sphaerisporangium sp. NPDC004334]
MSLPAGSIPAPEPRLWRQAVGHLAGLTGRRADWQRNVARVVQLLAARVDPLMVTAPKFGATWPLLARAADIGRSTLASILRWLRQQGLLYIVTPGSTPRYRGGADADLGNLAAEYLLLVPADLVQVDDPDPLDTASAASGSARRDEQPPWPAQTVPSELTRTPAVGSSLGEESFPFARARAASEPAAPLDASPAAVTSATKHDQLVMCQRLQTAAPELRGVSARHLRSLLRPLLAAGGTMYDALLLLERKPPGLRNFAGWVRHRLAQWCDSSGRLTGPLPSQIAARAIEERRAEQAALRAATAQARAGAVDAMGPAARARALLAASSPRAARVIEAQHLRHAHQQSGCACNIDVVACAT